MHGIIKAIIIVIAITIGHHLLLANLQRLPQHCWVMEVVSTVIHSLMVVHSRVNSRVKCVGLPISARTVQIISDGQIDGKLRNRKPN